MKRAFAVMILLSIFIFSFTACSPAATSTPTGSGSDVPQETPMPVDLPTAMSTSENVSAEVPTNTAAIQPEPSRAALSFTAATYQNKTNGFELDYPADWTLIPDKVIGSRGSTSQLFSPGSSAETLLEGGTQVSVTVYQWDPRNDLSAYINHRKLAWEGSGSSIISENSGTLADGRGQVSFTVQAADDQQAFFLFTTVGENYLEISGTGDLALVKEIAQTMRPLNFKP